MEHIELKLDRELAFKNGKAHAYTPKLNSYEEINGCEYFKVKIVEFEELERKESELVKQLEQIRIDKELNHKERLDLELNGYCPIDEIAYTRVGGVVVSEYQTHRKNCKHKGV